MLYKTKTYRDDASKMDELREQFMKIYEEHEIDVVGAWIDESDSSITYYMSRYKNEGDYNSKVEKLKNDERYSRLTESLESIRRETNVIRLTPMWEPS
jgi:hypothetical protein